MKPIVVDGAGQPVLGADGQPQELKLKLTIDVKALTLDDIGILMEPESFRPSLFKNFMSQYSNWTPAMVGKLTLEEMGQVMRDINTALTELAVPKVS